MKFENPTIRGESQDSTHGEWLEILAWSQGAFQPRSATSSTSGGHTSERCEHAPMTFVKYIDLVSPLLYQHLSGGTTFDEVTVEFFRADGEGNRVKYLEIKMKHVIISRVCSSIAEGFSPVDEFSLKFAAIQWRYERQSTAGNIIGNTLGAWSLTKNNRTYSV
jgi:type VI secretion system secreted protein Hcp